jgi:hypothetical protein
MSIGVILFGFWGKGKGASHQKYVSNGKQRPGQRLQYHIICPNAVDNPSVMGYNGFDL